MRKLFSMLLLFVCTTSMSQEKRVYFFLDFIQTRIVYKGGTTYRVLANYDAANQKMMYRQGSQLMELVSPELVDTIFTGGRKWVFHGGQWCESIVRPSGNEVLVGWHISKMLVGFQGALGSVSQVPTRKVELGGNFGMGSFTGDSGGGMYNGSYGVNQDDGNGNTLDVWRNKNENTYYFKHNGQLLSVKSLKQIYKLLPGKKTEIRQYLSDHRLDMLTAENALKVIDYLQTLK